MRKSIILLALLCAFSLSLSAQDIPAGYELVDSVIFISESQFDTTMTKGIMDCMPSNVRVNHSSRVTDALDGQVVRNAAKTVKGFRIRIYFDNKQDSRTASEAAMKRFSQMYPGVPAYRSFSSPFFKVTVGDYRTKADALAALESIKIDFPAAFIVKDKFRYPSIGGEYGYTTDTVKVLRQIVTEL